MATLSETKICLFWARIVSVGGSPFLSGAWNNDSRADPDNLTGGIPFNQGGCLTEPMYLTACGTGDAGVYANFGQAPFAAARIDIPKTYVPGWPGADGLPDTFDPASIQGSTVLSSGNRSNTFANSPGSVRSTTGWAQGRFYAEYQVNYDIFSQKAGMGVMRRDAQLNSIFSGQQNISDNFGGAMPQGGSLGSYFFNVQTFGVTFAQAIMQAPALSFMAIAIAMIPQYQYVPAPFSAVKLPDLICCPVARHSAQRLMTRRSGQY